MVRHILFAIAKVIAHPWTYKWKKLPLEFRAQILSQMEIFNREGMNPICIAVYTIKSIRSGKIFVDFTKEEY